MLLLSSLALQPVGDIASELLQDGLASPYLVENI